MQVIANSKDATLVQIGGVAPTVSWVPSRFNARATNEHNVLVLYNSLTGAFSGFPTRVHDEVEHLLSAEGFTAPEEGLVKYMHDRGFLVKRGTNELTRFRHVYGSQQYRQDLFELILLSSEECNFRCVYCYESFPRGTMEPWVRKAVQILLERRAPIIRRFNASYFGGEPLLGLEAIEELAPAFKRICNDHDVGFGSGMTTNGYLLVPETAQRLLDWDINSFQITMDGAPTDHNHHRPLKEGGDTFDQIYDNLFQMHSMKRRFRVAVRVNFDKTNIDRMHEFLHLMEPFKSDERFKFRFYQIGKWGGPNDDQLDVCGTDSEAERQRLDTQAAQAGFLAETRLPYLQPVGSVCYAARPYNLIIGADGKIMKCTVALDTADYNIVGRLTPEGHPDIDLDKLSKWTTSYFEDDESCRSCFYLPVCQGCSCPLPRVTGHDRPCPPEKLEIRNTLINIWNAKENKGRSYNVNRQEFVAGAAS